MKIDYDNWRFDWMRSRNFENIRANCVRAGDGSLDPKDFTHNLCVECDRDSCEWHPDTLAEEETDAEVIRWMFPDGGEDDGYDPDGRVTDD